MGIHIPYGYRLPPETVERNRRFLQQETDSFGTFISKDRVYYHIAHYSIAMRKAERAMRLAYGIGPNENITNFTVIAILQKTFGVPDFKMVMDGKLSMAAEVREALMVDPDITPDARNLVKLFDSYSAGKYMVGYLGQYTSAGMDCVNPDFENNRMIVVHPTWSVLSTSRFSASRPSVQNINRDVQDIFTAPKGYQLVHSDSGQIEPRITYSAYIRDALIHRLITVYDDAYFGLLNYILMTPSEEAYARQHLDSVEKKPVTDDMRAKRKRLKVLGLAGNYGSSNLAAIDPELGPLYEAKIVNHPARREWERQVVEQVRQGVDHFEAYFGTRVDPNNSKSADARRGSPGWKNHVIRCGINNPIQTTASELMHISLLEVQKVINYGEHVCAYIHDAGLFYIPESKVEERAPVFRNCLAYDVDGWIPIGSDLHIGREESGFATPIF